jgi:hypothetical protein
LKESTHLGKKFIKIKNCHIKMKWKRKNAKEYIFNDFLKHPLWDTIKWFPQRIAAIKKTLHWKHKDMTYIKQINKNKNKK